jgi:hypothetical protein
MIVGAALRWIFLAVWVGAELTGLLGATVQVAASQPAAPAQVPSAQPPATTAAAGRCSQLTARDFSGLPDATGNIVRTLPAFAYPLRPQYTGTGDVNDARGYVPVLPPTPTGDDIDWIGIDLLRR